MIIFPRKANFFSKTFIAFAMLALLSSIVFPMSSKADIVKYPDTSYFDAFVPGTNTPHPIVIEFDQLLQFPSGIEYTPAGDATTTTESAGTDPLPAPETYGTFTGIELTNIDGTVLDIRLELSGNKLLIHPDAENPLWSENQDYELSIIGDIVESTDETPVFDASTPSSFQISTHSLTFEELMSGSRAINTIIEEYTPRKINITAPQRYVTLIDIIHKRPDLVENNETESITNIDVTINHGSSENQLVKRIEVTPVIDGKLSNTTRVKDNLDIVPIKGTKVYDFGFTSLPAKSGFDIEVELYDTNEILLDKRIVKIPVEDKATTTIKYRDRYSFAGKTFTLYDLLNRPTNLQKLLNENKMNEITVQVVQN